VEVVGQQAVVVERSVREAELDPWPTPTDEEAGYRIVEGNPRISGRILWRSPDGKTASGIWQCTPGTIAGTFLFHETDYFVSGRMTCTVDGDQVELGSGDVATWPQGTETSWQVHETVRKLFTMHSDDGLPLPS